MIVVTGTKRSGTSMWMQVLIAAGLPYLGERFPGQWKESIGAANPEGFYESKLRRGVYGKAELDPTTGRALDPAQFEKHVVKIFVPGVVRTNPRYLGRVIASMRDFREYEESRRRMWKMEDDSRRQKHPNFEPPARLDPVFEWWTCNYGLLVDGLRRKYPLRLWAYDTMLEEPERTVREALSFVGGGDLSAALEAVRPEHRTQRARAQNASVEASIATVFEEFYEMVRKQRPLTRPMVTKLELVNRTLLPRLKVDVARVNKLRAERRAQVTADAQESHDDENEFELIGS
ncbi:MAG: hypothetical protein QM778_25410 [Myxococcales bacterium]